MLSLVTRTNDPFERRSVMSMQPDAWQSPYCRS